MTKFTAKNGENDNLLKVYRSTVERNMSTFTFKQI